MIKLINVSEDNYRDLFKLRIFPEQEQFVNNPITSLAKAYIYYNRTFPMCIYNNETMIGFVLIRNDIEDNYYFIWQFLIDAKYQNQGFGKKALKTIIVWIKDRGGLEIVTTCLSENIISRHLFETYGFTIFNDIDGEIDFKLKI